MKKNIGIFIIGLVVGIIVAAAAGWLVMPRMMLHEHESKMSYEDTVAEIQKSAKENGWVVPKIYKLDESLKKAGHEDIERITIFSLCQPHHAYNILKNDADKKVTAIMPCRIGVYEKKDGKVYVSGMNIGLMSKMFGGNIAEVMGGVADEEDKMFHHIYK